MFQHIDRWLGEHPTNKIEVVRNGDEFFARAINGHDEMESKGLKNPIHVHKIVADDSGMSVWDAIENLDIVFEAKYK